MDLLGRDVQVFPQAEVRTIHPLTGLSRGRVAVVWLHLEPAVVLVEQADDLGAGVRAAGVLEECLSLERRLSKGGKLRADKIQVQARLCVHGVLLPIHSGLIFARSYACCSRGQLISHRENATRPPARDSRGKEFEHPAMACDQWHCTHDTRREPPAKDSPRCRDDHNAYIAAHHAASPCHAYAATRHSTDTPRIDATMAEPVAVFPWLPSSSPHLPLIHSRISGVGLITGELGSPATPKDMPGGVSPRGIRTRARIDGLDPDIDHHCRRALAPCRCHGTFAARGPQRV